MKTYETKRQCLIAVISTAAILCGAAAQAVQGFVNVADFVAADGKADVSDAIQRLIEANPNRTLWFPDGTYLLSQPNERPTLLQELLRDADGWPCFKGSRPQETERRLTLPTRQ